MGRTLLASLETRSGFASLELKPLGAVGLGVSDGLTGDTEGLARRLGDVDGAIFLLDDLVAGVEAQTGRFSSPNTWVFLGKTSLSGVTWPLQDRSRGSQLLLDPDGEGWLLAAEIGRLWIPDSLFSRTKLSECLDKSKGTDSGSIRHSDILPLLPPGEHCGLVLPRGEWYIKLLLIWRFLRDA